MLIAELRPFEDKPVILRFHDGEITRAKISFVDDEYEDIIVDIIETNRPSQYEGTVDSSYAVRVADLASVEEIPT